MTYTLLGQWGFLDNLNDTSGNGHTATSKVGGSDFAPTYIDGPQTDTRAITFGDAGQLISYGRTGLEPSSGGIVSMGWAKSVGNFPTGDTYCALIRKSRGSSSTRHSIDLQFGGTIFWMSRWGSRLDFNSLGSSIQNNGWHHFCNIDAPDRYAWFIDGTKIAEDTSGTSDTISWDDFPWCSGADPFEGDYNAWTNASISGIRIFNGTMTDGDVTTWMNTPVIASSRSGKPKVWDGTTWNEHPAKVWNGTSWVQHAMKGFDGSAFTASK